jgi:uncharacterized protein YhaN
MLTTAALLVALLQSSTATVDTSRVAFTECLRKEVRTSLHDKVPPADFASGLSSKCEKQRDAFRAAVIAADRASGDSLDAAAQDANAQIDDYHQSFAEKYKDYSETNTLPGD